MSIRGPSRGPLRQHAEVALVVDVEVAVAPTADVVQAVGVFFRPGERVCHSCNSAAGRRRVDLAARPSPGGTVWGAAIATVPERQLPDLLMRSAHYTSVAPAEATRTRRESPRGRIHPHRPLPGHDPPASPSPPRVRTPWPACLARSPRQSGMESRTPIPRDLQLTDLAGVHNRPDIPHFHGFRRLVTPPLVCILHACHIPIWVQLTGVGWVDIA